MEKQSNLSSFQPVTNICSGNLCQQDLTNDNLKPQSMQTFIQIGVTIFKTSLPPTNTKFTQIFFLQRTITKL